MTNVVWANGTWPYGRDDQLIVGDLIGESTEWWGTRAGRDLTGAVVVIPGKQEDGDWTQRHIDFIESREWALTVITSDEVRGFPTPRVNDRHVVWAQYRPREGARLFPIGAHPATVGTFGADEQRTFTIGFSGQITHGRREEFCEYATRIGGSVVLTTNGFRKGLPFADYQQLLARSYFAPCPSGLHSLDSFRLYEAIAAGALPIVETSTPNGYEGEFWIEMFGEHPIPTVDSWAELPDLVYRYADSDHWRAKRDEVAAWWHDWRNALTEEFAKTLRRLRCDE